MRVTYLLADPAQVVKARAPSRVDEVPQRAPVGSAP
jgi:hypothetical protein